MGRVLYLLLALAALVSTSIPASAIMNSVDTPRERRSLKVIAKIPIIKKVHSAVKLPTAAKFPVISKIPVIGHFFKSGPEIPHLGVYPLWKVHRYNGISLQPVPYPHEKVPSTLPNPPYLPGEAPSIVNVPDPNYYPADAPSPPASEYGNPPSAPAPAPYPPAPYPSPPSGPYAPYAGDARGPLTSGEEHSSAFASSSSVAGGFDLSSLQSILPHELFNRVQQYASTPGGQERINALLGLATSAKKLKYSAAHSIQGMFQRFFGGAGGSTDVALNSGTYTIIPETYPTPQGIFNQFRAVGTGISGSSLPSLPDVPELPEIPGAQTLPPAPQLPHINLPDISYLSTNGIGGGYVSIQMPQAPAPPSPPEKTYGLPEPGYGPPQYNPPPPQYSPLPPQYSPPAPQYSPPVQPPSIPEIPSTSYGTPVGPVYSYPQTSGSATSSYFQAPRSNPGTPDASFAASDIQELYEEEDKEVHQEEEANNTQPHIPLKTTKLHRVSQPLRGEALRAYLDSRRGFKPSLKDQNKQTDNEIDEDVQD